jgi:hypothetical protein
MNLEKLLTLLTLLSRLACLIYLRSSFIWCLLGSLRGKNFLMGVSTTGIAEVVWISSGEEVGLSKPGSVLAWTDEVIGVASFYIIRVVITITFVPILI